MSVNCPCCDSPNVMLFPKDYGPSHFCTYCDCEWYESRRTASRAGAVGAHTHRWNVEEAPGGGIAVCRGHHDGGECEWEYFYPRDCGPDAADARRYRMLRDNFDGFDAGHGEPPRYVLTFQFPPEIRVGLGDRFDAAIDEALRAGGEAG